MTNFVIMAIFMGKAAIAASLILAITGCATTQPGLRIMESEGTVRVDISDSPDYDYKIHIKNMVDIGWDGDNPDDRFATAKALLENQCGNIDIASETPINTGTYFTGKPAITWVLKIRCLTKTR